MDDEYRRNDADNRQDNMNTDQYSSSEPVKDNGDRDVKSYSYYGSQPSENNNNYGEGLNNSHYDPNTNNTNPYGGYTDSQGGQQYFKKNDEYRAHSFDDDNYTGKSYDQYSVNENGYNAYQSDPYSEPINNKPEKKKRNTGLIVFIVIISVILLGAVIVMASLFKLQVKTDSPNDDNTGNSSVIGGNIDDVEDISTSASTVEAGEAAVVAQIASKYNVGILVYSNDSLYTEGSGVIAKADTSGKYTYIITCAHVINYKDVAVSVLMENGTEYSADIVGLDTRTDIGVVRIEAQGLDCAEFADSSGLIVGQTVYAVGNPGGSEFFGSITNGIISAIDRPISSSTGYQMECIQHTAAINPGNSGGALVNGDGKVIGINSMKIASTEYEGMGFSVPSAVVMDVFNSIIQNGYVVGRAKLGISYSSPSSYSQTYAMYVQMKGLPSGTIVIASIADDSALANEDVKVGDMITKVNGIDMKDTGMLAEMIEDMSAGDTLKLTIVRVNTRDWTQTEKEITVKLVEDKGTSAESATESQTPSNNPFGGNGSSYDDLYEYFKQYYGY